MHKKCEWSLSLKTRGGFLVEYPIQRSKFLFPKITGTEIPEFKNSQSTKILRFKKNSESPGKNPHIEGNPRIPRIYHLRGFFDLRPGLQVARVLYLIEDYREKFYDR